MLPFAYRISFVLLLFGASAAAQSALSAIGEVHSPDATVRGSVKVNSVGASIMSGSQITAGESTARIDLKRGGELQVCKQSSITVTSASSGREMLVALNSGLLEVHYTLASTSDTIVTPDFRLLLTGPGAFHFAIGAFPQGGMCVRSLAGNASSLIVNEQFGDGAHQVKPGEQINFRNGKVDDSTPEANSCGCPQPVAATTAGATPPALAFPEQQSRNAEQAVAAGLAPPTGQGLVIPSSQAAKPGQTFTQIDAPIVFRADEMPGPAPAVDRASLPPIPDVPPPDAAPPKPPEKKKWYQRFGSALASIFGQKH